MKISIEVTVNADIRTVWETWNNPEDIRQWNAASEDWTTTRSSVDLREGGKFLSRMEAKDGSAGFDFEGEFMRIVDKERIEYRLDDNRYVAITFHDVPGGILVRETFEAETSMDEEHQRLGWLAILENFARYTESKKGTG